MHLIRARGTNRGRPCATTHCCSDLSVESTRSEKLCTEVIENGTTGPAHIRWTSQADIACTLVTGLGSYEQSQERCRHAKVLVTKK
jgi:hypothetical protein